MTPYHTNIGRFMEDHPGWRIEAGDGGVGYAARRRTAGGRVRGRKFPALTLDQLAAILAREEKAEQERRPRQLSSL